MDKVPSDARLGSPLDWTGTPLAWLDSAESDHSMSRLETRLWMLIDAGVKFDAQTADAGSDQFLAHADEQTLAMLAESMDMNPVRIVAVGLVMDNLVFSAALGADGVAAITTPR